MKKILFLFLSLLLTGCSQNGDKTPLGWCVWEIQKHEGYEECSYTYKDVYPLDYKEESNFNVECYIITTYTEELRTEWYCFIEYANTYKRYLNPKEVYAIDCDIIWEINYEESGEIF